MRVGLRPPLERVEEQGGQYTPYYFVTSRSPATGVSGFSATVH